MVYWTHSIRGIVLDVWYYKYHVSHMSNTAGFEKQLVLELANRKSGIAILLTIDLGLYKESMRTIKKMSISWIRGLGSKGVVTHLDSLSLT